LIVKNFLLALILVLIAAPAMAETSYERVMRTRTIRCGYVPYAPAVIIDPNTKKFSGIIPEVMEEAARLLNMKVEWTMELTWGTTVDAVRTGKVDAICIGFWENPAEGQYMFFSRPLYYSPVHAYVRKDDHRFDKDLNLINDPKVTIINTDGEMSGIIARQDFPKAKLYSLPNSAEASEQMLGIITKKADVSFYEAWTAEDFMAKHPGTLRNITADKPMRVFADTIALPMDDIRLKMMLDAAFNQIVSSGHMDRIIAHHEKYPGSILRVAKPYEGSK
jgi:ABC-type amino acid transport substrate-binding protein